VAFVGEQILSVSIWKATQALLNPIIPQSISQEFLSLNFREMAIFFQKYGALERGLRQAYHHFREASISGFSTDLEFADFLPWLDINTPDGSIQSRDSTGFRPRSSGKKKCCLSVIHLTARPRTKRAPRGKFNLLHKHKSMPDPLSAGYNGPTTNEDGSELLITPTVHPCISQQDPMAGDGNSALFDLAYLVQASAPPPIIPLQVGNVHGSNDYYNSNAAFFNGPFEQQASFSMNTETQFATSSDYGPPASFAPLVYSYPHTSNTSDPASQAYHGQYPSAHVDYSQVHHQSQMPRSDTANANNTPQFYHN
jgi:hypothetical protein